MKKLALIALVGISSSAFASYELVLATDYTSGKIYRYDGDTGAALGSFGGNVLPSAAGIYAEASSGLCWVSVGYTAGMAVFDYSTGSYVNSFSTPQTVTAIRPCTAPGYAGQVLIMANGQAMRGTLSTSGFTQLATYSGSAVGNGFEQLSDGKVAAFTNIGTVRIYQPNGTLFSTSAAYPGYTGSDTTCSIQVLGSTLYASVVTPSGFKMIKGVITAGTLSWGSTQSFLPAAPKNYVLGTTLGHGNRIYMTAVDNALTGGKIYRYDSLLGTQFEISGAGNVTPWGVTTIVAPEPGTWLAMGLGALLVLRRRRA